MSNKRALRRRRQRDGEIGGWIVVLIFVIIATAGMTIWMLTTDMTIYEP